MCDKLTQEEEALRKLREFASRSIIKKEPCQWCSGKFALNAYGYHKEYKYQVRMNQINFCPNCGRKLPEMPEVEK